MIAMCLFNQIQRDRYDNYLQTQPFALNVAEVLAVHPISESTSNGMFEYSIIELKDGSKIEVAETLMEVLQSIQSCRTMAYDT